MDTARQCTALSKQSQQRCKRVAIPGHHVCYMHGGAIPAVKRTAMQHLQESVEPLMAELIRIGLSGESEAVRVAAIRDALDRAGLKPKEHIELASTSEFTFTILKPEHGLYNDG